MKNFNNNSIYYFPEQTEYYFVFIEYINSLQIKAHVCKFICLQNLQTGGFRLPSSSCLQAIASTGGRASSLHPRWTPFNLAIL